MKKLNPEDITISSVELSKTTNSLARVTVVFYGSVETHGWRVMPSKIVHKTFNEEIWIQAPCYKTYDSSRNEKWKEIVYIEDKDSWELVHKKIYEAYKVKSSIPKEREFVSPFDNHPFSNS